MSVTEQHYIDKSSWKDGEWKNEPDRVLWTDEASGYPCLIRRISCGVFCGYVGIPNDHLLHGKNYNDIDINCHGDLTYSEACDGNKEFGICHIAKESEEDDIWWFGFDCGHAHTDLLPIKMSGFDSFLNNIVSFREEYKKPTYKNMGFVKDECKSLASQLFNIRKS